jgi:excisionase family DNA binding protein
MQCDATKPLTYSITGAAQALSLGERSIYKLMDAGKLRRVKVGRRTLIPAEDVAALAVGA